MRQSQTANGNARPMVMRHGRQSGNRVGFGARRTTLRTAAISPSLSFRALPIPAPVSQFSSRATPLPLAAVQHARGARPSRRLGSRLSRRPSRGHTPASPCCRIHYSIRGDDDPRDVGDDAVDDTLSSSGGDELCDNVLGETLNALSGGDSVSPDPLEALLNELLGDGNASRPRIPPKLEFRRYSIGGERQVTSQPGGRQCQRERQETPQPGGSPDNGLTAGGADDLICMV